MTDAEPEPFRMSTDPEGDESAADAADPGVDDTEEAEDSTADGVPDDDVVVSGVESIADLIDEAGGATTEEAALEESDEAPRDRSGDVWGDGDDAGSDVDAVWAAAEEASAGSGVWGEDDVDFDVWGDRDRQEMPPPAADPTDPTAADVPTGRPSAAEGMDNVTDGEEEPDTFTFPIGDDEDEVPAATAPSASASDDDVEEPTPFRFDAGPDSSRPAQVPDHVEGDTDEEPETFSFAVDEGSPPPTAATPADRTGSDDDRTDDDAVDEWTVPSDAAADGDIEPDDDLWTFDVTTDTQQDDGTEQSLAESATPRDDAGWRDLDAEEEPGWSVPDLPLRRREDDEEEPDGFAASVDDDAPWSSGPATQDGGTADDDAPWSSGPATQDEGTADDDAPWSSGPAAQDDGVADDDAPWTSGPAAQDDDATEDGDLGAVDLPADVVTAEVHDALGDLLGNGDDAVGGGTDPAPSQDSTPAPAAEDEPDPLDELDDFDLDQFDDLAGATDDAPAEEPAADADDEHADEEPGADDPDGEALDAPTAARQVMEPGSVTFSSGGKKKKRGLFG